MAFVKLDCGMLDSTLWIDRCAREIFITALLMAEPFEVKESTPQIEVRSLEKTGFCVPPGWYGIVEAASIGIIRRAGIETEDGIEALIRLGSPESESRTPDFEGRRLVRVDGGFIVLNYDKYRKKDHTSAERSRRYRERKFLGESRVSNVASRVASRSVTQAEAEAEAENTLGARKRKSFQKPTLEELTSYSKQIGFRTFNAPAFLAKYDSIGWVVGKNQSPMKDWKAVVRTWQANANEKNGSSPRPSITELEKSS